jgi:hypothetical protein
LILPLTTDWLDPFLSGMPFLLFAESNGRAFPPAAALRPHVLLLQPNVLFATRRKAEEITALTWPASRVI